MTNHKVMRDLTESPNQTRSAQAPKAHEGQVCMDGGPAECVPRPPVTTSTAFDTTRNALPCGEAVARDLVARPRESIPSTLARCTSPLKSPPR
mmetsp:Transcript_50537/g.134428  ORF Transcript_50537/g.134428 Transcript_50537/m.134428 type:complete len:93 (+) Transcript_50537:407-685(+)